MGTLTPCLWFDRQAEPAAKFSTSVFPEVENRPSRCGWLTDRFGLCGPVVPPALLKLVMDKDRGRRTRALKEMRTMVKLDLAALERAADDLKAARAARKVGRQPTPPTPSGKPPV